MTGNVCPKCGQSHFPLSTYKKWIKEYDKGKPSPKVQSQIVRWQKLVDEHTTK